MAFHFEMSAKIPGVDACPLPSRPYVLVHESKKRKDGEECILGRGIYFRDEDPDTDAGL